MTNKYKLFSRIAGILLLFVGLLSSCKDDSAGIKKNDDPEEKVSLLSNPQKGKPITEGNIDKFTFASSDNEVILLLANNATGNVYAVNSEDHDPADASKNEVTTDISGFAQKIMAKLGIQAAQFSLDDMKVNPISKSIYLLARNRNTAERFLLKVTDGGETMELVNLEDVEYTSISYSNPGSKILDMAWGDNTLYLSYTMPSSLNGELAEVKTPFEHQSTATTRATTVFKTNWGGNYFTNAPLETMTHLQVKGESRLAGVTVCAPGFCFPTSSIHEGSGLLQVKEYYNLNTRYARKVFGIEQNGQTMLIEYHDNGRITKIGEKYLDGSQTKVNKEAPYLLRNGGTERSPGFNDEDVMILRPADNTAFMIAKYSDNRLYIIESTGELKHDFPIQ